ncbi:MrcB family domain-containing protein, partial [Klebsiella michiganensis]|uniref:MrcB family domain-containing protein n=1 Tax=Klebsiella michiganensis TaxID=1134687 RepID=UPI00386CA0A0
MIAELIKNFLKQADEKSSQSTSSYNKEYRNLKITLSFGKGSYADVPWIAFLGSGQTPSNGIYPVILYYKDYNELILAYGVREGANKQVISSQADSLIKISRIW